jgi:hypothetical protein
MYCSICRTVGDYQRQLFLVDHAGLPLEVVLEQLDLLGEEVVPVLRKEFLTGRPDDVPDAPTHESLVTAVRRELFHACGAWMARSAAGRRRLLVQVFLAALVTTAVLSLDATIVLLTPVVFATASRLSARPRPHVYAGTHLLNTASLLLPVSKLTNLLAFAASGLSFTRFAALMALPWLVAISVEYVVFRRFFVADLDAGGTAPSALEPPVPVFALVTVAWTLAGFVLASPFDINPAGAAILAKLLINLPAVLVLLPLTAPSTSTSSSGPARGEHRSEPHVRRIPGHPAVATHRPRPRQPGRTHRLPPARPVRRTSQPRCRGGGTVDLIDRDRRRLIPWPWPC